MKGTYEGGGEYEEERGEEDGGEECHGCRDREEGGGGDVMSRVGIVISWC